MGTEKYFHIGCIVKQQHLYELLISLEAGRVGNLTVRPVVDDGGPVNETAIIPASSNGDEKSDTPRDGGVRERVWGALAPGQKYTISGLASTVKAKKSSTLTALTWLIKNGKVTKLGVGSYTLKEGAK